MSDFLPMRAELSRKACDALIQLQLRLDLGELSPEAAFAAASAVYDVVSGLVPEDVLSLALKAREEFRSPVPSREVRILVRPGAAPAIGVLRRSIGGEAVELLTGILKGDLKPTMQSFADAELPAQAAAGAMQGMIKRMIGTGWSEI